VIRRRLFGFVPVLGTLFLSSGCGEPAVQQTSMPPPEWVQQFVKEHPDLFIKKIGKNKFEKIEGRDRRPIIREAWRKAQEQGTP
jgi:hypothetical protein